MDYKPFSCVWGKVSRVGLDLRNTNDLLVTIAGQELRFDRYTPGLSQLGLQRLTKRKVFLILMTGANGKHMIFAGWKSPPERTVLELQPKALEDKLSWERDIFPRRPTWCAY